MLFINFFSRKTISTLAEKLSSTTVIKPPYIVMISILMVAPLSANLGFLDSIFNLNRTVSSTGNTAKNIKFSKQNVADLSKDIGSTENNQVNPTSDIMKGSVLVDKLTKTSLYLSSDKSSPVVSVFIF